MSTLVLEKTKPTFIKAQYALILVGLRYTFLEIGTQLDIHHEPEEVDYPLTIILSAMPNCILTQIVSKGCLCLTKNI